MEKVWRVREPCDRRWDDLTPTDDPARRHCAACDKAVVRLDRLDPEAARAALDAGPLCAAFRPNADGGFRLARAPARGAAAALLATMVAGCAGAFSGPQDASVAASGPVPDGVTPGPAAGAGAGAGGSTATSGAAKPEWPRDPTSAVDTGRMHQATDEDACDEDLLVVMGYADSPTF